jgi:hypothetical protein
MALYPEREPQVRPVEERPEEMQPLTIERKEVATPVPTSFKQQVTGKSGQNLITTPQNQTIAITLPVQEEKLKEVAKGSIDDSSTWFAAFWLRLIKKAVHFGWQIISKLSSKNS